LQSANFEHFLFTIHHSQNQKQGAQKTPCSISLALREFYGTRHLLRSSCDDKRRFLLELLKADHDRIKNSDEVSQLWFRKCEF